MIKEDRNREVAIQLSNVKKRYKLGQIGGGTLRGDLQSWWAKIRGKEDPNAKIGQVNRLVGQSFMALNGIDLTIYQGEALGIIGGNGAGKSTLLKLLSRVTAPTEGEIDIYGRIASMLEVGTGFNGEMTGRENIYMNGAILGMTKAEIDSKMEDIIEFSEVREFIDTPVKRYSSGMYVKLAFSVAAHLDSEIMIMDEVLAVGDMAFQKKCLNKMRDAAKKEGRTVLYVSHNMNTIRQLCDRCIVLDKGKIIFIGDVEEAIDIYMGTTGELKSFISYTEDFHRHKHAGDQLWMNSLDIKNGRDCRYDCGEMIVSEMKCKVTRELSNAKFRLELEYQDGTRVGTMLCTNSVNFSVGEDNAIKICIDTKHLTPGRYKADIVAYLQNEAGIEQFLDGVYPGIIFELNHTINDDNPMVWLHKDWGHVHLHDVYLEL